MGHALHILRTIEKEYGPIESYLFPREPGSGDYLPNFFFKFRDIQSLYKLSKPYTHLDIPAFLPRVEPNHSFGLKGIHELVSPTTFPPSDDKNHLDDPIKARFAIRIEISDKEAYPQQRSSPQANAIQKNGRIQRALATWQPAALLARRTVEGTTHPQDQHANSQTKMLDLPASSDILPPTRTGIPANQTPASSTSQYKSEPVSSPPLRMRPRTSRGQVANPPQAARGPISAESRITTNDVDPEPTTALHVGSSGHFVQHLNSKRERILEQTRQAAATEAKLIADQKAAAEAAAAATKPTREIESQAHQNTPLSIWSRFLGR